MVNGKCIYLNNNDNNDKYLLLRGFYLSVVNSAVSWVVIFISIVAKWHRCVPWSTKGLYKNGKVYNDL